MTDIIRAKAAAGLEAANLVRTDNVVGLGTGSTAFHATQCIGKRVSAGLRIRGVATSVVTAQMAADLGIIILDSFETIDISIDGADEIDPEGNLIKGGGGALAREKIVASASRNKVYICDESKLVKRLGKFPLPVEILPFGWEVTLARAKTLGCRASLRKDKDAFFKTDNGNYVLDCHFGTISEPAKLSAELNNIPGVLDNGLFCGLTDLVIVGKTDGSVERIQF